MQYKKIDGKIVIGLIEPITIFMKSGEKKVINAKIDTGASKSSIDINLATELKLGPIIKSRLIKSAQGNQVRPVIETDIELAGKRRIEEFTMADRWHMKYRVLIGQNILKHGYLIDPSKH
ncbi:MAG: RimK/LysX family protein [Nanoarchaeota archaeon]|nr:RimK/LysX family protein [Nanoarchaeota archaeon]MBU1005902.1 RimK/LysX family protein [Nanoarchaeota archaeon]MBU1945393.1 RimK/LysX family protein [Nanoarchaeota archaeon]